MEDEFADNPKALLRDDVRRDQIDYRKWIVSLATFVLTVSLGLVGLAGGPLANLWLLVVGWALLGVCIFLNWLLIKRLVGISLVAAKADEDPSFSHLHTPRRTARGTSTGSQPEAVTDFCSTALMASR